MPQPVFKTIELGFSPEPLHVFKDPDMEAKQAAVPVIRLHDVRHTLATIALQQGVHPKVVQERLGHASITVTLDTYSHVIPTLQESAAEAIASVICPTPDDLLVSESGEDGSPRSSFAFRDEEER